MAAMKTLVLLFLIFFLLQVSALASSRRILSDTVAYGEINSSEPKDHGTKDDKVEEQGKNKNENLGGAGLNCEGMTEHDKKLCELVKQMKEEDKEKSKGGKKP